MRKWAHPVEPSRDSIEVETKCRNAQKQSTKSCKVTWWKQVRPIFAIFLSLWKINKAPIVQRKEIRYFLALVPSLLKLFKRTLRHIMTDSDCLLAYTVFSHLPVTDPKDGCMCNKVHYYDIICHLWCKYYSSAPRCFLPLLLLICF
jgi:hypothetical protein